jgi:hypothetical protein
MLKIPFVFNDLVYWCWMLAGAGTHFADSPSSADKCLDQPTETQGA